MAKVNKKTAMIVGSIVILLIVLYVFRGGFSTEGFEDGANTFTLYYADWCPHCKTVKPIFQDWSKNGSVQINGQQVKTTMIEESSNTDKSAPVKGYPTMLLKKAGSPPTYVEFSGDRTPAGWESWLAKNI